MDKNLQSKTENINKEHKKQNRRHKLLTVLAAVVVFCTTYALILPAITWERQLLCDLDEHTHSASCYEEVSVAAGYELTCTQEEHEHGPACFLENGEQICQKAEHTHSGDCYVMTEAHTETRLTCGKQEHVHCDACFDAAPAMAKSTFCDKVAHTHTKDCYFADGTLKCTIPEHTHSLTCMSNQNADVESAAVWEASIKDVALYGDEANRVIAIAESQLGYCASQTNFIVTEDGVIKPYSRYGAYCGDPYGDWCAMFCTFCINYAKVEDFPTAAECDRWIERLSEENLYRKAGKYQPKAGDLIFFDRDAAEGNPDGSADHVGFVYQVSEDKLVTIEGNCNDCVCTQEYARDDAMILGYAVMPGNGRKTLSSVANRPRTADTPTNPLPNGITSEEAANEWQVVDGRYTGAVTTDANGVITSYDDAKIIYDDAGNPQFLTRKTLVPTGTENEFLVYLDVEPVYYHEWDVLFRLSGILVNGSNKEMSFSENYYFGPTAHVDDVIAGLGGGLPGHSSMLVSDENAPLSSDYTTQSKNDIYIDTIQLDMGNGQYMVVNDCNLVFSLSQNSAGSFTIVYCAPYADHSVLLSQIWWNGKGRGDKNNPGLLKFPEEAYNALIEANQTPNKHMLQRSFAELITDPMGDHIIFDEILSCSAGDAAFDKDTDILSWDLSDASELTMSTNMADFERVGNTDVFAAKNAYQLVYKVHLDVEDEGFVSCADAMNATSGATVNPTNGTTTLDYHAHDYTYDPVTGTYSSNDLGPQQGEFDVPSVRGLLYDVAFQKVDEDGKPLPGAVFKLYQNGVQIGDAITTDDSGSTYRFTDLPWGSYTLVETPPEGYTSDNLETTMMLSFTENQAQLTPDSTPKQMNMRYSPDGSANIWKIVNIEGVCRLDLKKTDESGNPLAGAEFKLFRDEALTQEMNVGLTASNDEGIFTPEGFKISYGIYYLLETKAPDGYYPLTTSAKLVVDKDGVRVVSNGKEYKSTVEKIDGKDVYTLAIVNFTGTVLPSTGGIGAAPFYMLGTAVLLSAGAYALVLRRKRERGTV